MTLFIEQILGVISLLRGIPQIIYRRMKWEVGHQMSAYGIRMKLSLCFF